MENKETPFEIQGIGESLYGGFWARLGVELVDFIILFPVYFLWLYINSQGKLFYCYTWIPFEILYAGYYICFVKIKGGTLGKLILGLRIVKTNGESLGWQDSILRYC